MINAISAFAKWFKPQYRIISSPYGGYKVQASARWLPIWTDMSCEKYESIDRARANLLSWINYPPTVEYINTD